MQKLNKVFVTPPQYEADGYKVGHPLMICPNTSREYFTWIPRSIKYMPKGIKKIMSSGQQIMVRYLHSSWQEHFFDKPIAEAHRFTKDMGKYLMMEYNFDGFEKLHKLGYLPIKIKALPEGMFTKPNIPHMTGITTTDDFAFLGLYLETQISKLSWQCPTAATIGYQFKKNAVEWVKKTDPEMLWLADFLCHDFHSRGGNPYTSIAVGLGHAMSNKGSDTLNVIPASRYYYDFDENDVPIYSVNASEHSVTCTGIFYYEDLLRTGQLDNEIEWYYSFKDVPSVGSVNSPDYLAIAECSNLRDWLLKFPKGILSVVSDTMDLWKLITHILPRLKNLIMAREGKLVIRPDSGDPVDITCGLNTKSKEFKENWLNTTLGNNGEYEGVIELLWNIFGGETTSTGYKRLDSHIGAIYGDSINLERQIAIYTRLAAKGFAATNIVLGIGSFTYVMLTRDSAGYAAKGAWFETKEFFRTVKNDEGQVIDTEFHIKQFNIYKDPITDDGTKKSLKGFCAVFLDENNEAFVQTECSEELEDSGELKTIYEDGKFYNQTTLEEIRERINKTIQ
jgi:nicotinamide phosphoribosyltransferase